MSTKTPTQSTKNPIDLIHDDITVSAWGLHTTQGTLEAIQGAFDDIATVLHLIGHGNLLPYQIQALTRITHSYAFEWSVTTDGECQMVNQMLGGSHD